MSAGDQEFEETSLSLGSQDDPSSPKGVCLLK